MYRSTLHGRPQPPWSARSTALPSSASIIGTLQRVRQFRPRYDARERRLHRTDKQVGFGSIRYPGGTISNLFNWKTTIGPRAQRLKQIHGFYNNPGQGGIEPNFGIGEIATFADEVNSEIVYVYSLGRGNAQDARI